MTRGFPSEHVLSFVPDVSPCSQVRVTMQRPKVTIALWTEKEGQLTQRAAMTYWLWELGEIATLLHMLSAPEHVWHDFQRLDFMARRLGR